MILIVNHITEEKKEHTFSLGQAQAQRLEEGHLLREMQCQASIRRLQDKILVQGSYQASLELPCTLCLQPVSLDLDGEMDLELVNQDDYQQPQGDIEVRMEGRDVVFFQGNDLDLVPLFEDQLLLDLPLSIHCKPDCRGICPNCKADLNHEECRCKDFQTQHPFSVLKGLDLNNPED